MKCFTVHAGKGYSGLAWRHWQRLVIAGATLLLCSCQSLHPKQDSAASSHGPVPQGIPVPQGVADGRIQAAVTPAAAHQHESWLCNGGDLLPEARPRKDWSLVGLEPGGTIAHYATRDGRLEVERSNCVCLYAPRFAAIRRVHATLQHEQHERGAGITAPVAPVEGDKVQLATTTVQPLQLGRHKSAAPTQAFRERTRTVGLEDTKAPAESESSRSPYEDFLISRRGQYDQAEQARLAASLSAAVSWSHDRALQVVLDNRLAVESSQSAELESVYTYDSPAGKPRLRILKLASRKDARPGDVVDFTLRLENVGDQVMDNVTIVDNLVARLEYVEGSQECSLEADFSVRPNESESQTLRWELRDPLEVGEGGVIRFRCLVR